MQTGTMPSPAAVKKNHDARLARERQAKRDAEEREISANRHYMYDLDCSHHCSDCCPALAIDVHI